MIASRVGTTALRRVVAQPNTFFNPAAITRTLIASQSRPLTTEKLTPAAGAELLASQRLSRPISPHLAIYDIQQTWFGGSIWTRITGSAYSGALYVFGAAYLIAPLTGWHLESASLAAAFGALPLALKGGLKFLMAWPFVFHCVNGTRHLFYDMGKGFAKAQIRPIGWAIWGASLIASLGLAFY